MQNSTFETGLNYIGFLVTRFFDRNIYNRGHNLLIKIQFFPMIFPIVTPFRILSVMPPFPPEQCWRITFEMW